jgi:hypothetical protein
MMEGIFLYYLWIVISLVGFYTLLRCTYRDKKFTDKVKFPLLAYLAAFMLSVIPVLNIIAGLGVFAYMTIMYYDDDYYYKVFLFKEF